MMEEITRDVPQSVRAAWANERQEMKLAIARLQKEHRLEFTYVRNRTKYGEPYAFGGAVVCWQQPTRRNARIIPVAISWCHDRERFDKVVGRYRAMQYYLAGRVVDFRLLPGTDSISSRLLDVFEHGFLA